MSSTPFCPFADGCCTCENQDTLLRRKREVMARVKRDIDAAIPESEAVEGEAMGAAFRLDEAIESGQVNRGLCDNLKDMDIVPG